MKTKQISPEKSAKKQLRKEKELRYWKKQKARPKGNTYFWYLVLIIAMIYAVDEIASQISTLMQTEIANTFFQSESAVTLLNLLQIVAIPFQIVGILYRPLADRFGRKTFLIINTFGMSFAMFMIFLSQNVYMYFFAACLIMFFIPHDMHVVYIMETAPSKSRAITYSVVKFFANMAVMLVPFLRRWLMETAGQWRRVYFIPAVVGIVVSLIALFCARETDAFIDSRIRYLKMTEEELQAEKLRKTAQDSQGGVIDALKFGFNHKQLRWVFICFALAGIGVIGSLNYQAILTHGYAMSIHGSNVKEFLDLVLRVRPAQVTLVPDKPSQLTSNCGWDTVAEQDFLREILNEIRAAGIRSSIFINADIRMAEYAAKAGADRVELYTGPYAHNYTRNREEAIAPFFETAQRVKQLGIGLNAGHDLSLENLTYFTDIIPWVDEVSIGHALICDALYMGLEATIAAYQKCLIK